MVAKEADSALDPLVVPSREDVAAVIAHPLARPMRATEIAAMIGYLRKDRHPVPVRVSIISTEVLLNKLVATTVLVKHPLSWWRREGFAALLVLDGQNVSADTAFYARPQDLPDWYQQADIAAPTAAPAACPEPPPVGEPMITTIRFHDPQWGDIHLLHNGDFSGEVVVSISRDAVEEVRRPSGEPGYVQVRMPFAFLQTMVAAKVRRDAIVWLEDLSVQELLTLR